MFLPNEISSHKNQSDSALQSRQALQIISILAFLFSHHLVSYQHFQKECLGEAV